LIRIESSGYFKTSSFETATLDVSEKAGFRPLFPTPVSKPTGF
jgi:hypothetical protein